MSKDIEIEQMRSEQRYPKIRTNEIKWEVKVDKDIRKEQMK